MVIKHASIELSTHLETCHIKALEKLGSNTLALSNLSNASLTQYMQPNLEPIIVNI